MFYFLVPMKKCRDSTVLPYNLHSQYFYECKVYATAYNYFSFCGSVQLVFLVSELYHVQACELYSQTTFCDSERNNTVVQFMYVVPCDVVQEDLTVLQFVGIVIEFN